MGTLVEAHSVGTVSTSDLALLARLYRQGPGSKSESFFRWSWALVFVGLRKTNLSVLRNRLRAGGAVSGLLTLLVRFGGVELGSWLRVAGRAVGGGCVDAPRRLRRCLDASGSV